jgi:hypothetical protein
LTISTYLQEMLTELQKMLAGELYDASDEQLTGMRARAIKTPQESGFSPTPACLLLCSK